MFERNPSSESHYLRTALLAGSVAVGVTLAMPGVLAYANSLQDQNRVHASAGNTDVQFTITPPPVSITLQGEPIHYFDQDIDFTQTIVDGTITNSAV